MTCEANVNQSQNLALSAPKPPFHPAYCLDFPGCLVGNLYIWGSQGWLRIGLTKSSIRDEAE